MHKIISTRFQHEFQSALNESEENGYKLIQFTHDDGYYFGVVWKDDDWS